MNYSACCSASLLVFGVVSVPDLGRSNGYKLFVALFYLGAKVGLFHMTSLGTT